MFLTTKFEVFMCKGKQILTYEWFIFGTLLPLQPGESPTEHRAVVIDLSCRTFLK